jgi:hypothetical protein
MSRFCVQAEWGDVTHLDERTKAELLASMPPHMRDARTKGIPMLGAGAIYPLPEAAYTCEPFEIPAFWPKAYGMDVGWNRTAAVWGAWDRQSDVVYVWSEHYVGQAVPAVHAAAIQARGAWMNGAIDPGAAGSNQRDGAKLIDEYRVLGLNLVPADNAVEAGIHACYQRMATGRLKIFRTCRALLSEIRIYRRDEKGKIVKENDHACDCLRYLILSGMRHATIEPAEEDEWERANMGRQARSTITGY